MSIRLWRYLSFMVIGLFVVSVGCGGSSQSDADGDSDQGVPQASSPDEFRQDFEKQESPAVGKSSFVSAAGEAGDVPTGGGTSDNNNSGSDEGSGAGREIQRGDIYRVLENSRQILNLNHYRGLQIIDFSEPESPSVIGRAKLFGDPVEMYLIGDKVYALINDWRSYEKRPDRFFPKPLDGFVVAVIDISDPTNPVIEKRHAVPGKIKASRLTRGDGQQALFVASEMSGYSSDRRSQGAYVESFNVSDDGVIEKQSEIELGGDVRDIQGVQNHLILSREPPHQFDDSHENTSKVTIIDISDPAGEMVKGDEMTVQGQVENKHNMDFHDGILRVVSASTRSGVRQNHFYTYDASDIQNISHVDHTAFGEDMRLEATLFMDDRAFFVTFRLEDPFHTFKIEDNGTFEEKNEFIVSGWNDFFTPVHGGDRLIGIGKNDTKQAVSLYDATDLSNPEPMLDREEGTLRFAHSDANWDDRGYTVLEDVTSIENENGTVETGLVLLPYWSYADDNFRSGVEIYSFSDKSVTRRGKMEHATPVRRSFPANRSENLTANLSEDEMSLYDTSDPDSPVEKGRVDLAPNYNRLWVFDDHYVRRNSKSISDRWYDRNYDDDVQGPDTLEVVSTLEDPDLADEVASIEIPGHSQVVRHKNLLVVVEILEPENGYDVRDNIEKRLQIWDLSEPEMPTKVRTLETRKLGSYRCTYERYRAYSRFLMDYSEYCGGQSQPKFQIESLGDALVFVDREKQQRVVGTLHRKHYSVVARKTRAYCEGQFGEREGCTYYSSTFQCKWMEYVDGTKSDKTCTGSMKRCTIQEDDTTHCKDVSISAVETETNISTTQREVYWHRYVFMPLDLTTPSSAEVADPVKMPETERDATYITDGDEILVSYREPYDKRDDPRGFVKYYFKPIDFSSPTDPKVGDSINIPGELLARDGSALVTKDYLWGSAAVENSIDVLEVRNGKAYLQGLERFDGHAVRETAFNGSRELVVSHQATDAAENADRALDSDRLHLAVLDLTDSVTRLVDQPHSERASLRSVRDDKALYAFRRGLITVDLSAPGSPQPQGFLPVRGWPQDIESTESKIYVAVGLYGIYSLEDDRHNL